MSKKIISLLVMTFLLYFGNVGVSAAKEVAQNKKSVLELFKLDNRDLSKTELEIIDCLAIDIKGAQSEK